MHDDDGGPVPESRQTGKRGAASLAILTRRVSLQVMQSW